jgi:hypothetical protein
MARVSINPGSPSSTVIRTFPAPFTTLHETWIVHFPAVKPLPARKVRTDVSASARSLSSSGAPRLIRDAEMIWAAVTDFCPDTSTSATSGMGRRKNSRSALPPSSRTYAVTSRKTDRVYRRRMDSLTFSSVSRSPGRRVTSP